MVKENKEKDLNNQKVKSPWKNHPKLTKIAAAATFVSVFAAPAVTPILVGTIAASAALNYAYNKIKKDGPDLYDKAKETKNEASKTIKDTQNKVYNKTDVKIEAKLQQRAENKIAQKEKKIDKYKEKIIKNKEKEVKKDFKNSEKKNKLAAKYEKAAATLNLTGKPENKLRAGLALEEASQLKDEASEIEAKAKQKLAESIEKREKLSDNLKNNNTEKLDKLKEINAQRTLNYIKPVINTVDNIEQKTTKEPMYIVKDNKGDAVLIGNEKAMKALNLSDITKIEKFNNEDKNNQPKNQMYEIANDGGIRILSNSDIANKTQQDGRIPRKDIQTIIKSTAPETQQQTVSQAQPKTTENVQQNSAPPKPPRAPEKQQQTVSQAQPKTTENVQSYNKHRQAPIKTQGSSLYHKTQANIQYGSKQGLNSLKNELSDEVLKDLNEIKNEKSQPTPKRSMSESDISKPSPESHKSENTAPSFAESIREQSTKLKPTPKRSMSESDISKPSTESHKPETSTKWADKIKNEQNNSKGTSQSR